jgi:hypothetical protein
MSEEDDPDRASIDLRCPLPEAPDESLAAVLQGAEPDPPPARSVRYEVAEIIDGDEISVAEFHYHTAAAAYFRRAAQRLKPGRVLELSEVRVLDVLEQPV